MTDTWQYDMYGRHFTSTENRIELARKLRNVRHTITFKTCADCELYSKKMVENSRRNRDAKNYSPKI